MKKLEKEFEDIFNDHVYLDNGHDKAIEETNKLIDKKGFFNQLAEESLSIAIEFSNYKASLLRATRFNEYIPTDEEFFSDFIEERYKDTQ